MPLFGHKNKNHNDNAGTNTMRAQDPVNTTGGKDWDNTRTSNDINNSGLNAAGSNDPSNFAGGNNQRLEPSSLPGGPGAGVGTGTHTGHNHGNHHQGIGGAVGSAALREQAMKHDREAQNFQAQSKELAEAERLEQQAREHRERAVAQGAHPTNKHPGGGTLTQGGPGSGLEQSRGGNF